MQSRIGVSLFIGCVLFVGLASTSVEAQVEICELPDLDILDETRIGSELLFDEAVIIEEVKVYTDITHTFIGDLILTVTSPSQTRVLLFRGFGHNTEDILVTWSDSGDDPGTVPFTCDCEVLPPIGEDLADFQTEGSEGTWLLEVRDKQAEDEGTLNEWCVIITECNDSPPISDFVCDLVDSTVTVTWTGPEFEEHTLFRNGEELATFLAGDDLEYVDEELDPGTYVYQVEAVDTDGFDCFNLGPTCFVDIGPISVCSNDAIEVPDDGTATDFMPIGDVVESVIDLRFYIDLVDSLMTDVAIAIRNSEGTRVEFVSDVPDFAFRNPAMDVTFGRNGRPFDSSRMDCQCPMLPLGGVATIDDLLVEDECGNWDLRIQTDVDHDGTLNEWCVVFYGEPAATADELFVRGDVDGSGAVFAIIDAVYLLEFGFVDGPAPPCDTAADVDADGAILPILDAVYLLSFAFQGAEAIPNPYPECGPNHQSCVLTCESPPVACE